MDRKIAIFDTTLRDGMQGIEINYTLEDKLEIAAKLDELGIDYIEGGFPLSNDKEAEFFRRVRDMSFSHAKVASFGSTRKAGGQAHSDGQSGRCWMPKLQWWWWWEKPGPSM
jgi:2-isopropylmalate synthase